MAGNFNIDIVFNRFPEIAKKAPKLVSAVVSKATFDVEARAKSLAPVDTGNLKGSISGSLRNPHLGFVKVGAEYGAHLEFGTVKMAAQPYLRPAADFVRPSYKRALAQVLRKL